jgi:hypothetical protein
MKRSTETALWAALSAFFGSLLALGIIDIADIQGWVEFLGALVVAAITAGGVYSKERLEAAREEDENNGI